jgi:hypothetical protein
VTSKAENLVTPGTLIGALAFFVSISLLGDSMIKLLEFTGAWWTASAVLLVGLWLSLATYTPQITAVHILPDSIGEIAPGDSVQICMLYEFQSGSVRLDPRQVGIQLCMDEYNKFIRENR